MNKIADINVGDLRGPGWLGFVGEDAPDRLAQILSIVIGFFTAVAFIYFTIMVFIGGVGWISAGGDKGKVEQARAKITSGVQGVVVVIAAIFVIQLVGMIFDIDFLDIAGMVGELDQNP